MWQTPRLSRAIRRGLRVVVRLVHDGDAGVIDLHITVRMRIVLRSRPSDRTLRARWILRSLPAMSPPIAFAVELVWW